MICNAFFEKCPDCGGSWVRMVGKYSKDGVVWYSECVKGETTYSHVETIDEVIRRAFNKRGRFGFLLPDELEENYEH